jgi:hypothetical protein
MANFPKETGRFAQKCLADFPKKNGRFSEFKKFGNRFPEPAGSSPKSMVFAAKPLDISREGVNIIAEICVKPQTRQPFVK